MNSVREYTCYYKFMYFFPHPQFLSYLGYKIGENNERDKKNGGENTGCMSE